MDHIGRDHEWDFLMSQFVQWLLCYIIKPDLALQRAFSKRCKNTMKIVEWTNNVLDDFYFSLRIWFIIWSNYLSKSSKTDVQYSVFLQTWSERNTTIVFLVTTKWWICRPLDVVFISTCKTAHTSTELLVRDFRL